MIYVKKYVALWIVAGFLSCCAQLTLFAMSPAVIAAKQREFRKHIATFKKLNASGKGMDPQAAEASEKAKKVINEVRPYTDVKWMEILLETEIKEKEEKFHEDADSALWHIGGILGQLENKHNPYFTVGKRETLGTKFFKELHTKITNDARELLTKKYGISEVKKENYLTGTGKSYPGGLFYLLDEQHNKFIDFANIFGHTNKSFYKQTDTQISVFDSIKRDLSYIIFNIYYSPTENNTNHFTIDKNSGLLLTPKQVKDVISDYNNLQKSDSEAFFIICIKI